MGAKYYTLGCFCLYKTSQCPPFSGPTRRTYCSFCISRNIFLMVVCPTPKVDSRCAIVTMLLSSMACIFISKKNLLLTLMVKNICESTIFSECRIKKVFFSRIECLCLLFLLCRRQGMIGGGDEFGEVVVVVYVVNVEVLFCALVRRSHIDRA